MIPWSSRGHCGLEPWVPVQQYPGPRPWGHRGDTKASNPGFLTSTIPVKDPGVAEAPGEFPQTPDHLFQRSRVNSTRTGNSSSRPTTIKPASSHFDRAGRAA